MLIVLLAVVNCKNNTKEINVEEQKETKELTLEGVWEIDSYVNYGGETYDTIRPSSKLKQRKMFSKSKVMWSKLRAWDSLDWFGVGDYTFKDGILTEVLDYGSKPVNEQLKTRNKWIFNIKVTKDRYSQIIVDSLGNYIYAENYIRVD
ncbi:hypothetical protein EYD45_09055 [Hyunsoonleella flava]|uniref:Lipocalin-like domain-containing protein n=1 Tax=Hyunsoonleella flava TaxID=2527939 RepID=A0A4Q9FFY2_9FLAO|nr:hypothetical protein [Hyunsoonleella flava]TBN03655.1 hypothetical protein EYD45_09055 [Hyunsoonleella flava]